MPTDKYSRPGNCAIIRIVALAALSQSLLTQDHSFQRDLQGDMKFEKVPAMFVQYAADNPDGV
jgi:hypothetical protein